MLNQQVCVIFVVVVFPVLGTKYLGEESVRSLGPLVP
jgi:hypothetical protein